MKKRITALLIVMIGIAGVTSCSYRHYDEYIIGKWNGVEWESEGTSRSEQIRSYWFEFREDGTYASYFGGVRENGTYRLENNKLYTNASDEEEIVVEIRSLSLDTMRIGMNRGGVPETLVLAKE